MPSEAIYRTRPTGWWEGSAKGVDEVDEVLGRDGQWYDMTYLHHHAPPPTSIADLRAVAEANLRGEQITSRDLALGKLIVEVKDDGPGHVRVAVFAQGANVGTLTFAVDEWLAVYGKPREGDRFVASLPLTGIAS